MTVSLYFYVKIGAPDHRIDEIARSLRPVMGGEVKQPRYKGPEVANPNPRYWKSPEFSSDILSLPDSLASLLGRLVDTGIKSMSDDIGIEIVVKQGSYDDVVGYYLSKPVIDLAAQLGADVDIDVYYASELKSPAALDTEAVRDFVLLLAASHRACPEYPLRVAVRRNFLYDNDELVGTVPLDITHIDAHVIREPAFGFGTVDLASIDAIHVSGDGCERFARTVEGLRGVAILTDGVQWLRTPEDTPL